MTSREIPRRSGGNSDPLSRPFAFAVSATSGTTNRFFSNSPKPVAGKPAVIGIDIHRDCLAEVGFCFRDCTPLSTALAPQVQGRRPIDWVWTQGEITAPAFLAFFVVASHTGRHPQVVEDAAA